MHLTFLDHQGQPGWVPLTREVCASTAFAFHPTLPLVLVGDAEGRVSVFSPGGQRHASALAFEQAGAISALLVLDGGLVLAGSDTGELITLELVVSLPAADE